MRLWKNLLFYSKNSNIQFAEGFLIFLSLGLMLSFYFFNYWVSTFFAIIILFWHYLFWKSSKLIFTLQFIVTIWFITYWLLARSDFWESNSTIIAKVVSAKEHYCILRFSHFKYSYVLNSDLHLKSGDNVKCYAHFHKMFYEYTNIYEFDFQKYLISINCRYQISPNDIKEVIPSHSLRNWINVKIFKDDFSSHFLDFILTADMHSDLQKLYGMFSRLGVMHLLVISGYHINILLYSIKKLLDKIWKNPNNLILLFFIMFFYLYFINFKFTAVKAISISFIYFFNKKYLNNIFNEYQRWFILLLTSVFFFPYCLWQLNFIYGLSITLVLSYMRSKVEHLSLIKKSIFINIAIFFICLGWNIYFNYTINIMGIFFNFILLPFISVIYITSFIVVFIIPLHNLYGDIYWLLFGFMNFLENINWAINVGHQNISWIGLYYILWGLILYFKEKLKIVFSFIGAIFLTLLININSIMLPDYRITMLNVGDGNSIVLQDKKQHKNIMYDIGSGLEESQWLDYDYLRYAGIKSLDTVFISHYHLDHYNNYENIKKMMKIKHTYDNDSAFSSLKIGSINFQKLHSNIWNSNDENDNCLVLLATFQNHKLLLMGDATARVEKRIVYEWTYGAVDYLQVSHHGSRYSSIPSFINKVQPKYAFISCSPHSKHGFPGAETIRTLTTQNAKIYQTRIEHNINLDIKKQIMVINYF